MFIWPKEVIFSASENYLLPPKIVGWGGAVFQGIDKKIE